MNMGLGETWLDVDLQVGDKQMTKYTPLGMTGSREDPAYTCKSASVCGTGPSCE